MGPRQREKGVQNWVLIALYWLVWPFRLLFPGASQSCRRPCSCLPTGSHDMRPSLPGYRWTTQFSLPPPPHPSRSRCPAHIQNHRSRPRLSARILSSLYLRSHVTDGQGSAINTRTRPLASLPPSALIQLLYIPLSLWLSPCLSERER